jgi:hypothetical protein
MRVWVAWPSGPVGHLTLQVTRRASAWVTPNTIYYNFEAAQASPGPLICFLHTQCLPPLWPFYIYSFGGLYCSELPEELGG